MNLSLSPNNDSKALIQKKLAFSILRLAWPAMVAMVFQSLSSITDVFFLGRINNPNAQAALGFYGVLTGYLMAYNAIIGNGSVCVIAQYFGAGKIQEASNATVQTILLKLGGSILLVVPLFFVLKPLMILFGAEGEALELSIQYGKIMLLVFPLINTGYTFNTALRAAGDALTPMFLMLSTLIINLCLNVLFIFGIGFFPRLGIIGVAYATVLAQLYLMAVSLWVYTKGKKNIQFSLSELLKPNYIMMKKIFKIGLPSGYQGLIGGLANSIIIRIISLHGMQVIASYIVVTRTASISGMLVSGLAFATSAIVGQHIGAGHSDRSYQATVISAWIAGILTTIIFIFVTLFPELMLRIFTTDVNILSLARPLLPLFAFLQIWQALAGIFGAPLMGTGYLKVSFYVSLVTVWLFQIPFMWILGSLFGLNGIWASFIVSSSVNLYLMARVFKKRAWMNKVI